MNQALAVAIELAERKRDDAGNALAVLKRRQDHAFEQMAQLEAYAADTQNRWSAASQVLTSPQIVGHSYQFMERLDQTVALQQGVTADLQRQSHAARQILLEAEVRLAGLQRALAKQRAVQSRLVSRQEQRQTDEFAARAFTMAMSQTPSQDPS